MNAVIDKYYKYANAAFVRYVICGITNVSLTYILYVVLVQLMNYRVAYTITYLAGTVISYFLNSKFTFKVNNNFRKFYAFCLVYGLNYVLSFCILYLLIHVLAVNKLIAPLLLIIISVPIIFLLSRKAMNID